MTAFAVRSFPVTTTLCVWVVLLLAPGRGEAQEDAQEGDSGDSLAQAQQAVASARDGVRQIEQQLADDPRNAALWEALIMQRSYLVGFERGLQSMTGAETPQEAPGEMRRLKEAWIGEWIAAMPDDPLGYVYRANVVFAEQPEARSEALRDLAARFPDDFETQSTWARDLQYRGAGVEAIAVMDDYLSRHPTREAFFWVHRYYERAEPAKAGEVLDRWFARHPDDPGALHFWYNRESRSLSRDERRALAADIATRVPAKEAAEWCGRVLDSTRSTGLEAAESCFEGTFARVDRGSDTYNQVLYSYTQMLVGARDLNRFEKASRLLPDDLRQVAVGGLASSLFHDDQCDQGVAVLRASGTAVEDAIARLTGGRREPPCARTQPFRDLVAETIETADLSILGLLVRGYSPYMPAEPIEAALKRRLAATPGEDEVYKALDDLYRTGDLRASATAVNAAPEQRRIALLESLLRAHPSQADLAMRLSEAQLMAGQADRALQVLEAAAAAEENHGYYEMQGRLAALYAQSGRWDDAAAVGQRMLASDVQHAYQGHLLLAQLALSREDLDQALAHYERFFDAAGPLDWKMAEEYKYVLAGLDDGERLVGFLEGLWEKSLAKGVRPEGAREEWIAKQLEEAGAVEPALVYYERRLATTTLPPGTLSQIADLAEEVGRFDLAERVRLARRDAAVDDEAGWVELAEHYLLRQQTERAFFVLEQAFQRLPKPGPWLWLRWADALLGSPEKRETVPLEDLVEAIQVLERGKSTFVANDQWGTEAIEEKLRELYLLLGRRDTPKDAGAAAAPP